MLSLESVVICCYSYFNLSLSLKAITRVVETKDSDFKAGGETYMEFEKDTKYIHLKTRYIQGQGGP